MDWTIIMFFAVLNLAQVTARRFLVFILRALFGRVLFLFKNIFSRRIGVPRILLAVI
ncbi:hypothetical protein [Megasphaera sp. SC8-1]|uniref:hypothetical protein n=1 Tax=Megasphaera sp. SC8-1 TaxID=2965102 RepID=UPI00210BC476|nr:hypothetical protein [Megasphaera sp. SC8-1]